MNGAAWLLALATLGVDYGWRLDDKGQVEYIIQVSPAQWESLRDSPEGISSAIPPEVVRHVRKFRIVVGNEPLPRDPLPAFSADGGNLGAMSPINVDAARVVPAGGDFPTVGDGAGFSPTLESSVTPLESLNAPRNALPGPGRDFTDNPSSDVHDILPIPPIPRASGLLMDAAPLSTTNLGPALRRESTTAEESWRPNVNAPDTSDAWGSPNRNASLTEPTTSGPAISRSPPRRELTNAWTGATTVEPQRNYLPLLFAVCALCLSIGGNVYLGWIAWGYYLRYRESFESLRSNWTPSS